MNQFVKGHFIPKLLSRQTDTHSGPSALPGPLNWSVASGVTYWWNKTVVRQRQLWRSTRPLWRCLTTERRKESRGSAVQSTISPPCTHLQTKQRRHHKQLNLGIERVQACLLANISHSRYVAIAMQTRAPIANLPNSAQLGGIPYHSLKLHPGSFSSVGMRPRTDRQTQTDRQTHTHTDARDHNTFRVVYDSCEM